MRIYNENLQKQVPLFLSNGGGGLFELKSSYPSLFQN